MKGKHVRLMLMGTLALALILAVSAEAQVGKFGFVDSEKIFTSYKEWQKAQDDYNAEYKAWDEEGQTMQQELEDLIVEYDKQKLILSPEKKKEREAAIEAKRQALDAFTKQVFGPSGQAEKRNSELVRPLLEKINNAIERVAVENNYDFIFNSSGLAYARQDYDVTDKILEALEE